MAPATALTGCLGLGSRRGRPPVLQVFEIVNTRSERATVDVRVEVRDAEVLRETHTLKGVQNRTADTVAIECAWPPDARVVLGVRLTDDDWVPYDTARVAGDCIAVEARIGDRGVWIGHAAGPCPLPDARCHTDA